MLAVSYTFYASLQVMLSARLLQCLLFPIHLIPACKYVLHTLATMLAQCPFLYCTFDASLQAILLASLLQCLLFSIPCMPLSKQRRVWIYTIKQQAKRYIPSVCSKARTYKLSLGVSIEPEGKEKTANTIIREIKDCICCKPAAIVM
jgi:hypothetical protein